MCYSLWYNAPTMLPAGHRSAKSWMHYTTSCNTQSSVPEDGQNNCPKHVELTELLISRIVASGCLSILFIFHLFFEIC